MLNPPITYVPATSYLVQPFSAGFEVAGGIAAGSPLFEIFPLAASDQPVLVSKISMSFLTGATIAMPELWKTSRGTSASEAQLQSLLLDSGGANFNASALIKLTWGVDPVATGVALRNGVIDAAIGANLTWTLPTPIEVGTTESLTVFHSSSALAVAPALGCWVELYERQV